MTQPPTIDELFKAISITVMAAIALWETCKKLADIANAWYTKKRGKEKQKKHITELYESDQEQNEKLDTVMRVMLVQTRHSIVRIALEALKDRRIEAYELQSLEEMYQSYREELGGNSYVHNLMDKVRELPVDSTNGAPKGDEHEGKIKKIS